MCGLTLMLNLSEQSLADLSCASVVLVVYFSTDIKTLPFKANSNEFLLKQNTVLSLEEKMSNMNGKENYIMPH